MLAFMAKLLIEIPGEVLENLNGRIVAGVAELDPASLRSTIPRL
jgi:hypothetical protein